MRIKLDLLNMSFKFPFCVDRGKCLIPLIMSNANTGQLFAGVSKQLIKRAGELVLTKRKHIPTTCKPIINVNWGLPKLEWHKCLCVMLERVINF